MYKENNEETTFTGKYLCQLEEQIDLQKGKSKNDS
jgi:hypothetical protein